MLGLSLIWLHNINEDIIREPIRAESVVKVLEQEIENAKTYIEVLEQYKAKAEFIHATTKGQKELIK